MKTEIKSSSFSSSSSIRGDSAQLELGLERSSISRHGNPRRRRQTLATVWFRRMREVVDCARDWRPAPPPRPVQPLLGKALSHEKQLAE